MCTLGDYAASPLTSPLTNKHTCSGGTKIDLKKYILGLFLKNIYFLIIVLCYIWDASILFPVF